MGRAFREGKGVIRSDAMTEAEKRGITASSVLLDVPAPPSVLDIFSKFQQRREDFDANWILAQEDPQDAAAAAAPPINAFLKAKLKDQAKEFQSERKRRREEEETSDPEDEKDDNKRLEVEEEERVSHPSPSPFPSSRTTSHKMRHPKEEEEEEDEDAEYNPEEEVAIVASHAVSSATTTLPPPSPADPLGGERQRKKKEKDGLQGEFIGFVAETPANGGITSEDLVVRMAPFPSAQEGREGKTKEVDHNAEETRQAGGARRRPWASPMEEANGRGGYVAPPLHRRKEDDDADATEAFYARFSTAARDKGAVDPSTSTSSSPPSVDPRRSPLPPLHGKPIGMAMPLWSSRRIAAVGGYCDAMLHPTIALHQEVMDLVAFLRPTVAEVCVRRYIAEEVERMAQSIWPETHAVVFGSLRTGLLLPLSDVDMTLADVPWTSPDEALPKLAQVIDAAKFTNGRYPQVILKTKVPLVKFQHAHSEVEVDISLAAMNGMENTSIVRDLLRRYPEAHPLTVVIKYFLHQRNMNDAYTGGLGSYATTLLVISFLQHHPIYTTHPEERPCTGLGKLLVDFFRYYGLYWNFNRCRISIQNGGSYALRTNGDSTFPFARHGSPSSPISPTSPTFPNHRTCQLEIEDPGNEENNAASSVRQFHTISSFFTHAYLALTANGMGVPSSPRFWEVSSRSDVRSPHGPPPPPPPSSYSSSNRNSGENGRYASGSESFSLSSSSFSSSPSPSPSFLPPVEAISPDAADIRLRPTLLSRILHVDPESLQRRRCVEVAYHQLCKKEPEKMHAIRVAVENDAAEENARVRKEGQGGEAKGTTSSTTPTTSGFTTRPSTGSLLDRLRAAAREQRTETAPSAPSISPISSPSCDSSLHGRTADEEASIRHLSRADGGGVGEKQERKATPRHTPHTSSSERSTSSTSSSASSSTSSEEDSFEESPSGTMISSAKKQHRRGGDKDRLGLSPTTTTTRVAAGKKKDLPHTSNTRRKRDDGGSEEESRSQKDRVPWAVDVEAEERHHTEMETLPHGGRKSRSPRPLSSSSRTDGLSEKRRPTAAQRARSPRPLSATYNTSPVPSSSSPVVSSLTRLETGAKGNESSLHAIHEDAEEREGSSAWEAKKRRKEGAEKKERSRSSSDSRSRGSSSSHADSISTDVVKKIHRRNQWRKGEDSQKKKNRNKN